MVPCRVSEGDEARENQVNCMTTSLTNPTTKSVIGCWTDGPEDVGANTNWSGPLPPLSISTALEAKITSLPDEPWSAILGPAAASLKIKFTLSDAPKLSATGSAPWSVDVDTAPGL